MARQFSHIYLISSSKQKLKGEWSGSKGAACMGRSLYMCVSWSMNGLHINGTDTALEPPQYFWIYSKATPFLPAHLELPTIHPSLILQMTPPTHAPQSCIPSPTVPLHPPKPCPQPWSKFLPQTPSSTQSLPVLWPQPFPPPLLLWDTPELSTPYPSASSPRQVQVLRFAPECLSWCTALNVLDLFPTVTWANSLAAVTAKHVPFLGLPALLTKIPML